MDPINQMVVDAWHQQNPQGYEDPRERSPRDLRTEADIRREMDLSSGVSSVDSGESWHAESNLDSDIEMFSRIRRAVMVAMSRR